LLDFGSSGGNANGGSRLASQGDLLGGFSQSSSRSKKNQRPRGSLSSSSSAASGLNLPKSSGSKPAASTTSASAPPLDREALRRQHEREIKARADEKLAAVREREDAATIERSQKDNARGAAELKINLWTGNGTRRGNLRALIASLDAVLYPGSTWTPISMDVLKNPSKVKISYHKAILQVHPDKIGSKNLPPDQQVLAELIFDELQNGHEVWTAEKEGRPPPSGTVGPKNAPANSGCSGFGGGMNMNNMSNMYQQQQQQTNFGRGGFGVGTGGFGVGRGGMGGGLGRGNLGGGLGAQMPGFGAQFNGMGRGNMYGAGRGGLNQQQRR
jgi:hypothetical protein